MLIQPRSLKANVTTGSGFEIGLMKFRYVDQKRIDCTNDLSASLEVCQHVRLKDWQVNLCFAFENLSGTQLVR